MSSTKIKSTVVGLLALLTANTASSADLVNLTATEALQKLKVGEVTSEALVTAYLKAIESKKKLNAYIYVDADKALAQARAIDKARAKGEPLGLLAGLPITLKDNIQLVGMPNTAGTPSLKNFMPSETAPVASALVAQGAIVIGKTNMHELAFGVTSNNGAFGAVHNAYASEMIPGGSSGGTAAAVAGRLAVAGIGTDTGASVRLPSALNGVVGFRPTVGRYSSKGVTPISITRDTPGPIARNVADVILLDTVVTGGDEVVKPDLRKIRIGVMRSPFWENLDPETRRVAEAALEKARSAGVEIVDIDVQDLAELDEAASGPIALYEAYRDLPGYLEANKTGVSFDEMVKQIASEDVKGLFAFMIAENDKLKDAYAHAMKVSRPALQQAYADAFASGKIDAIVFPTSPLPARPIKGSDQTVELNAKQVPTFATYGRNVDPATVAGIPGISIPVGLTEGGLPIGLEFDGAAWSDRHLLGVAQALEALFPPLPAPSEE